MEKKATKLTAASLAAMLAVGLTLLPVTAFAKNGHGNGAAVKEESKTEKDGVGSTGLDKEKQKGLHRAIENVKNTPAEETISNLLSSKYEVEEIIDSLDELAGTEDSSELTGDAAVPGDEEIEAVANEIRKGHKQGKYQLDFDGLTQLADVYDRLNKPSDAIDTQEEAIAEKPADLEGYKKLGKLKKKAGKSDLQAFVNGETVLSDVPPLFVKGRAMVPFRAISASLKATVEYKADGTVIVSKDGVTIELKTGSTTALVNGKEVQLSVAPISKHNRVFVPFRFIGEAFSMNVNYEPESGSVIVNDPEDTTEDGTSPEDTIPSNGTEAEASTGTAGDAPTPEPSPSTSP